MALSDTSITDVGTVANNQAEHTTCAGNAVKTVLSSRPSMKRRGILIKNHDAAVRILVLLWKSSTAPTTSDFSTTKNDFDIAPKATLQLDVSEAIGVYLLNDSGGATTAAYTAKEYY